MLLDPNVQKGMLATALVVALTFLINPVVGIWLAAIVGAMVLLFLAFIVCAVCVYSSAR